MKIRMWLVVLTIGITGCQSSDQPRVDARLPRALEGSKAANVETYSPEARKQALVGDLITRNDSASQRPVTARDGVALPPLAPNAEIAVISGYEPKSRNAGILDTRVTVNRPGKTVVLVLVTYEKMVWHVDVAAGTTLQYVIAGGYKPSEVFTNTDAPLYRANLPYAYEADNINFQRLLTLLQSQLGIRAVDSYQGAYGLPAVIVVDAAEARPEWSLDWPAVTEIPVAFDFELLAADRSVEAFTLRGPQHPGTRPLVAPQELAIAPDGRTGYRIAKDAVAIVDLVSGKTLEDKPLPANFTDFVHSKGIAYDTDHDLVAVATSGGDGAFYRFDAKKREWQDFRSFGGAVDVDSLSYDPIDHVYVAARWNSPGLIFLDAAGLPLETHDLGRVLPGLGRVYDRGNYPVPPLTIVPRGEHIAIMVMDVTPKMIWYYNKKLRKAALTYRRP